MGPIEEREVIGYADQEMVDANPGLGLEVGTPLYSATDEEVVEAVEAEEAGEFSLAPRQDEEVEEECESCSA